LIRPGDKMGGMQLASDMTKEQILIDFIQVPSLGGRGGGVSLRALLGLIMRELNCVAEFARD